MQGTLGHWDVQNKIYTFLGISFDVAFVGGTSTRCVIVVGGNSATKLGTLQGPYGLKCFTKDNYTSWSRVAEYKSQLK